MPCHRSSTIILGLCIICQVWAVCFLRSRVCQVWVVCLLKLEIFLCICFLSREITSFWIHSNWVYLERSRYLLTFSEKYIIYCSNCLWLTNSRCSWTDSLLIVHEFVMPLKLFNFLYCNAKSGLSDSSIACSPESQWVHAALNPAMHKCQKTI